MSHNDQPPSRIRVTMLLAEAAQVAEGKLYVLGGGLAIVAATPAPLAIAAKIDVPWDRADVLHEWKLELLDADGMPVMMNELPVLLQGQFQVARSEHLQPGTPLPMPLALNFSGLVFPAEQRFAWRLIIDDETEPDWQVAFTVAPMPSVEV